MMEFSSLVWTVPVLFYIGVIISFTVNHSEQTVKLNISIAAITFVLSLIIIVDRYISNDLDYGYYMDWFVVDNFYYRIGYELNYASAYFLVVITALNLIILLINRQIKLQTHRETYGYINLICGLVAAIVISDNVLTYYIISFCTSVALFLKLAQINVVGMVHTLRSYSKALIIGHLLFLCALILIFYHQPNHAVEFTVIDSSLNMQPDLLDTEYEWIIGLLLVLSTVFISSVLVPFERQLREKSLQHIVTVYVMTSLRILIPAYMLIRFESLIRIDAFTEMMVVLLGVVLLIYTCYKMVKYTTLTDILLNMSNAMLGMLYVMYGLQTQLMISALVLVYLVVYLLIFLLIIFNKQRRLATAIKIVMSIILQFPIVISISASHHYSVNLWSTISLMNIITCLGVLLYSLVISLGLKGLRSELFDDKYTVFRLSIPDVCLIVVIILLMLISVSFSWWDELKVEEHYQFAMVINSEMWVNIAIICIIILIGFMLMSFRNIIIRQKNNDTVAQKLSHFNLITSTKANLVKGIEKIELAWDYAWEKGIPYVFKKGDQYFTSKQPHILAKLAIMWLTAIIIAIMLIIIRG